MVIPQNQDGKTEDLKNINQAANQTVSSSRKGGVQSASSNQESKVCRNMSWGYKKGDWCKDLLNYY